MAANVLKRLGPTTLTATAATLGSYTVGTGRIFVVRHVAVTSLVATIQKFSLSIGTFATGTSIYTDVSVTKDTPFDWSGFRVLVATELFQAKADAASSLNIEISGVEMDVPT